VNTGQTLWQQDGELIPNIAVVIGDDKLYYMEKCQSQTDFDQALQNRDALISNGVYEPSTEENIDPNFIDVRHIVALDLEGGQVVWDKHVDITGCGGEKAGLIWQNDVLLIAGHFQLKDLNSWYKDGGLQWRRITSFNGDNSEILWSKPLNYSHRPPIIDNKIIAEPRAVDIQSGEFIDRRNPITGKYQHFFVDRMGKNCAPMQGSRHMLFFRRQDIEMFDFENDIGITRVGSVRPSCWINMIAANGLALFPEGASGCSCPYPIKTSFAMKQVDHDQYSAWAAYPQRGPLLPVDNLCINFGAPGDRKDKQGKLWLGYPRPGVVENELSFDLSENVLAGMGVYGQDYRFKQFCNTDRPWLFGAGIIGIENLTIPLTEGEQARFTVRIGFTALPSDSEGSRVFNLKFGQDTVLLNFDLFSEAGGADHIIVKEFQQVPVTGDLAVEFIPVADDPDIAQAPLVNFIEIEREYLADINKDKNVDFLDFSLLLQHWHNTDCNNVNNWCDNTDFNEDGFINVFDLEILTNNWLNR
jgi:hypothetical protein